MENLKKQHPPSFKAKVALEALKEIKTSAELAGEYQVHPTQIRTWKAAAKKGLVEVFADRRKKKELDREELIQELYRQIGQLKVDLDWLKKNLAFSHKEKLLLLDKENTEISLRHQAELLGISRSSIYYQPVIDPYDLFLMKRIDEQYTRMPFYGSRKMTAFLRREGHWVNRKRVQGLMRQMGLEAIYPRPRLSQAHPENEIYPYLLRNVSLHRVDQVWAADITYIRLCRGFVYLVAVMDWVSRYVVSWALSTGLEVDFCLAALERAFRVGSPEIFNTDQGSQFTSRVFIEKLKERQIQISMDGRGRVFDNIFTERLWRSLKYEDIYLKDYRAVPEAEEGIAQYFTLYNEERLHQSLNYRTPAEVYFQRAVLL